MTVFLTVGTKKFSASATFQVAEASHGAVMRCVFKSLMIARIAVLTASALVMQTQSVPGVATAEERPAGCHEHGRKAPLPQPASYTCCLGGHDSVLLTPSTVVVPVLQNTILDCTAPVSRPVATFSAVEDLPTSSGDPPGATPLRI